MARPNGSGGETDTYLGNLFPDTASAASEALRGAEAVSRRALPLAGGPSGATTPAVGLDQASSLKGISASGSNGGPMAEIVKNVPSFTPWQKMDQLLMALALIAHLHDEDRASDVADRVEYEWHRDSTWDPYAALNGLVDPQPR